ncbi:MAG TPA: glycosyltransferase family 2 protein [Myxococcota bacterium]|nr:glycosyltransferase family 2 protein [Myxococcota bacterium]
MSGGLSVVLPAYNESANIRGSLEAVLGWIGGSGVWGEVIVVDDGSVDDTAGVVRAVAAADRRVRLVQHTRNLGYGAALRSGFAAARGEYVFFTDADLQFRIEDMARLSPFSRDYDVVVGYREQRADPLGRRINARAWNELVNSLFSVGVRDVDCAFKLFHRRVLERVGVSSTGAFLNSELLVRARSAGFRIKEVPVPHYPRLAGRATGARVAVIGRAFWELLSLHEDLRPGRRRISLAAPAS